ncbi:MAG: ABC transporter ATP-binding protein, partial [Chloroflexaceae bacterium]|nr:ABC transporter ATP-binding protein [Chloroflexaceae bacterium]
MLLSYSGRHHAEAVPYAPALETAGLAVRYPGAPDVALHDVTLSVQAATRVALVGPNGSGKSTLLKAVAGLLPVEAGKLLIYGLRVGACHHRVAYLPQRGELDWRFPITVQRLVLTGRYVHLGWLRRPRAADFAQVHATLDRLGIGHLAHKQVGELSGGQQQRALLARALVQEADMLLLDEPFNAVDDGTRSTILQVLRELKGQGKTLLVATHDMSRIAEHFDRVIELR